MEEIKVRAYNLRDMKMHYDITGVAFYQNGEMSGIFMDGAFFLKEEVYLMQYTGLHDKNGKEIYEGDIVQHLYEYSDVTDRYLVDYDEDELRYVFQNLSNKNNFIALEDLYDEDYGDYAVEIIGNIWEDSDLLNDSKNTETN